MLRIYRAVTVRAKGFYVEIYHFQLYISVHNLSTPTIFQTFVLVDPLEYVETWIFLFAKFYVTMWLLAVICCQAI